MEETCRYCGTEIPEELLNTINNSDSIVCQNCGVKISNESHETVEDYNRINDNNQTNGLFRRVYEKLRNRKSPIERVFYDSDFPIRFRDDFKIVVSRLVYPHIQALKYEAPQDKEGLELNQEILDDLYEKINPIMNHQVRVRDKFLTNLYNMRVKEFDKWLKILQKKIKVNNRYSQDFVLYLRWLIREAFIIITELWDEPELPRFEGVIRDDLKLFSFNLNGLSIKNQGDNVNIHNLMDHKYTTNFKQKVLKNLRHLHSLIDGTKTQKELIWFKAIEILDYFISRTESNEFNISKEINLRLFVAAIVYTSIISQENMPRVSIVKISKIAEVNSSSLGRYYRKYLKNLYPKSEFLLSVYRLGRIRNYISLHFFEKLKVEIDFKTSDLIKSLKKNVLKNKNLPAQLTQEDINTLKKILTIYQEKFVKYFSDLVEIVRTIIISSVAHKKINALFSVNSLVAYLRERNVNLLQKGKFYNSIDKIFNFLKGKFPEFFPMRWGDRENLPKKEKEKRDREYRRIISSNLKLYILKNIYNGKYYKDGIIKCPECLKEGLKNNIYSLRLKALDCHHSSAEKENIFKSDNLFLLFNQNRGNPNVLENMINLLESEEIALLCRNHHTRLHFNDEFDYIINWKDLFSLPAELIHLLVKISIKYCKHTKYLSPNEKASKKKNILRKIKKRYIIESFYGEFCHVCGEFGIRKDLNAFDFHHQHKDLRNIKAHELYDTHSCPEIAEILIQEKGGYICSNCHTVIEYKLIHLLNDIYNDENIVKKILNDYNATHRKFTLMNDLSDIIIKAPLKKSLHSNETFERYLTAIYEISKSKNEVTLSDLANFTGLKTVTIHKFFKKNSSLLKICIEMKIGVAPTPTKFILTGKGKELVSLIYHFKNYYSSL